MTVDARTPATAPFSRRCAFLSSRGVSVVSVLGGVFVVVLGVVLVGCAAGKDPGPAPVAMAAVGDSFVAGTGAAGTSGACARAGGGWVSRLAVMQSMELFDVSCAGADLAAVREQVLLVPPSTSLVVLTVGANDVSAVALLRSCRSQRCAALPDGFARRLEVFSRDLSGVLVALSRPTRRVVVVGYPSGVDDCPAGDPRQVPLLDEVTVAVNDALASAVTAAADAPGPVSFLGSVSFAGHGLCSQLPWVHDAASPLFLHPTGSGHQAVATQVAAALAGS